jgi:hypothetical protein
MNWQSIRDTLFSTEVVVTITITTLVLVAASIAAVPFMVVRLPADYFAKPREPLAERFRAASLGGKLLIVLKNFGGAVLVLLGLAMLVLPGQGILTVLFGLVLLDLPKKHVIERKIVARPTIRKALTKLRARFDRPPFEFHDEPPAM